MSKKNETNACINNAANIEKLMASHENVSLRRIAVVTNVTYSLLLKAARKPVPGTAYDPEAVNFTEIARYFDKREINLESLDWDELNASNERGGNGKVIKSVEEFNIGDDVYLRDEPSTPYEVVYKTETHIVLKLEGTTIPRALSNNTFLLMGPQRTPRTETSKKEEVAEEA